MLVQLAQTGTTDFGVPGSLNQLAPLQEAPKSHVFIQIINVVASLGSVLAVFAFGVFWIVALVGVIRRSDLKHEKLIWVLLLLLAGPIGMICYFFMEDRKKYGIISLVLIAIPLLMLPLYAVARFIVAR